MYSVDSIEEFIVNYEVSGTYGIELNDITFRDVSLKFNSCTDELYVISDKKVVAIIELQDLEYIKCSNSLIFRNN